MLDGVLCGKGDEARKTRLKNGNSEEVVAVTVGYVDVGEGFVGDGGGDPVCEGVGGIGG